MKYYILMSTKKFQLFDEVSCYCEEYSEVKKAQIIQFRNKDTQAYVHFDHEDKRLDRWINVDELSSYEAPSIVTEERVLSRRDHELLHQSSDDDSLTIDEQKFEELHKEVTKIRNIEFITIGKHTVRTWYFSPYPKPYSNASHLYICDHCFQYFLTEKELKDHIRETGELKPPGREIYRKDNISIFEIFGKRQKLCCQCLCLLAKMFLDHKTLFYDVEGFIFYVLCECDEEGAHLAAYFSREINSEEGNILACIVALPPYQKKGYGRLLISLSYEIAKRQQRSGGPERPLSDLGKIAFNSYWRDTILDLLKNYGKDLISIDDLVTMTSITRDDVIDVLRSIKCVSRVKGEYELMIQKENLASAFAQIENGKPRNRIDPMNLIWILGDDERTDYTEIPNIN